MALSIILAGLSVLAAGPAFITYEQFGAVGDGVHDDQSAIIAAHNAANEKHLSVKAKDGATYYIGGGSDVAVIRTDVDFGTARFIIDDVNVENRNASVFRVESYLEPYEVEGVGPLKKGQKNLGVKLPQRSLVEITDSSKRVYIRRGANQDNGSAQTEVAVVEKDGTVRASAPLVWDFDNLKVKAWPIDSERLTIKGGTFVTVANKAESKYNYHSRNIVITRSNVVVELLSHYIVGEGDHGAPYGGFISVSHAADVEVRDCLLTPHRTYGTIGSAGVPVNMGSYDIDASSSVGLTVRHLRQTISIDDGAYWGLFASNYCKDIRMEDCVISRFDAHKGVCNVTLTDCTFGYMGVQFVGFGTALMQNCEVHRDKMVWLRSDYGSSWDGEVIIRDCRLIIPQGANAAYVMEGSNDGHHDFGYDCTLPRRVEIDGLYIDDSAAGEKYRGPAVYNSFDRNWDEAGLFPFPSDGKVIIKNVTTASGKKIVVR